MISNDSLQSESPCYNECDGRRRRVHAFSFSAPVSYGPRIESIGHPNSGTSLAYASLYPYNSKAREKDRFHSISCPFPVAFSDVLWYNEACRKRGDASYSLEEPFSVTCTTPDKVPFFFCLFGRWTGCCSIHHGWHGKSFNAPWFILQNRSTPHFYKMHGAVYSTMHWPFTGVSIIQCTRSFTIARCRLRQKVESNARGRLRLFLKTNARGRLRLFLGSGGRS